MTQPAANEEQKLTLSLPVRIVENLVAILNKLPTETGMAPLLAISQAAGEAQEKMKKDHREKLRKEILEETKKSDPVLEEKSS